MGCWHGTCAISQLPIKSGDPVRVALIALNQHDDIASGYSYPVEAAFPVTPACLGTYDDYGGATFDNPDEASVFCFDGLGIDLAELDEGGLQTAIREPITFNSGFGPHRIGLWMVHEPIYQHMMRYIIDCERWRPRLDWKTLRDLAEKQCDAMAEVAALKPRELPSDDPTVRRALRFWSGFGSLTSEKEVALEQLWERMPVHVRAGFQRVIVRMNDMVWDGAGREEMLPFCYAVADHIRLYEAMDITRRGFWVQAGAGSQSEEYASHISLIRCILDVAEEAKRKNEEEWESEDDGEAEEG